MEHRPQEKRICLVDYHKSTTWKTGGLPFVGTWDFDRLNWLIELPLPPFSGLQNPGAIYWCLRVCLWIDICDGSDLVLQSVGFKLFLQPG